MLGQYTAGREVLACLETVQDNVSREILAAVERLVHEVKGKGPNTAPAPRPAAAPPLCSIPDLSLLNPRGKHNVRFYPECLVLAGASGKGAEIQIPTNSIQAVAILDNIPKDQKGKVLMFLSIKREASVMHGKQVLEALVIQTTAEAQLSVPVQGGDTCTGPAAIVLCQLLGMVKVTCFVSPDPELYSSCKGDLAVSAVSKVNDGFLFPMPSGALCFVERPAVFIPYHNIRFVSFARTGGASSTFDLEVHLRTGDTIEFSQIGQGELGRLQSYFSRVKVQTSAGGAAATEAKAAAARERGAASGGAGPSGLNAEAAEEEDDDSSDEEDDDFDPNEEDGGGGSARASKRKRETGGAGPSTSNRGDESEASAGNKEKGEEEEEEEEEEESSSAEDSEDIEIEDEEGITAQDIAAHMGEWSGKSSKGKSTEKRQKLFKEEEKEEEEDDDE